MFDNTVGKTSSRSESFGKKTKKKVNREILDLKTFQTQADNGFDDPVEKTPRRGRKK